MSHGMPSSINSWHSSQEIAQGVDRLLSCSIRIPPGSWVLLAVLRPWFSHVSYEGVRIHWDFIWKIKRLELIPSKIPYEVNFGRARDASGIAMSSH